MEESCLTGGEKAGRAKEGLWGDGFEGGRTFMPRSERLTTVGPLELCCRGGLEGEAEGNVAERRAPGFKATDIPVAEGGDPEKTEKSSNIVVDERGCEGERRESGVSGGED